MVTTEFKPGGSWQKELVGSMVNVTYILYMERERERDWLIDPKGLAHTVMEANKSWDPPSASWRSHKANDVVSVQRLKSKGTRPRTSWCFSSRQSRRINHNVSAQCSQAGRNSPLFMGGSVFLLCSGLQMIEWIPSSLRRVICVSQTIDSNVKLIQKHSLIHRINVSPSVQAFCGPVKLTN